MHDYNTVSPSSNLIWRNWFQIYTNVYDGKALPILRQKMALSDV
jgi:hypothetical protein